MRTYAQREVTGTEGGCVWFTGEKWAINASVVREGWGGWGAVVHGC